MPSGRVDRAVFAPLGSKKISSCLMWRRRWSGTYGDPFLGSYLSLVISPAVGHKSDTADLVNRKKTVDSIILCMCCAMKLLCESVDCAKDRGGACAPKGPRNELNVPPIHQKPSSVLLKVAKILNVTV